MTSEVFAEWLRRRGYRVVRTGSGYWFNQGPRVFQAMPYHHLIEPDPAELRSLFRGLRALGVRYSSPPECGHGKMSYHAVLDRGRFGLEALSPDARHNVRRGLRRCTVEPISFDRLAREGWSLHSETLLRQGRNPDMDQAAWGRLCSVAGDLPGFEAWGALAGGHLLSSLIVFHMGACAYLLHAQCRREALGHYVNNAVSFVVTDTILRRPGLEEIFYGLESLDAPPTVDEFKFRMGYRAKPVRQCVELHPVLAGVAGPELHRLLCFLHRVSPRNNTVAKAEGLLRFYRSGSRPLSAQDLPRPFRRTRPVRERRTVPGAGTSDAAEFMQGGRGVHG